jgi:hypothetical protein
MMGMDKDGLTLCGVIIVYFRARNGTFKMVPLFANLGLNVKGGMTIY